jgi:hypothetical protein
MIICSKHEGNGTTREFVIDDAEMGDKVSVKTHLVDGDDDWHDAGVITRAGDVLEVSVLKPSRRFVKLDKVFPNEVAALQAIAVSYEEAPVN